MERKKLNRDEAIHDLVKNGHITLEKYHIDSKIKHIYTCQPPGTSKSSEVQTHFTIESGLMRISVSILCGDIAHN